MAMANRACAYIEEQGMGDRIIELDESIHTVALAAAALHCGEREIAKTLAFLAPEPVLIVASGDARVDNGKFRGEFGCKAKMIPHETVEELTGFPGGGVCPFNPREGVKVYLDVSLRKLQMCYPACGSRSNAVRLSLDELERLAKPVRWVDVTKEPGPEVTTDDRA